DERAELCPAQSAADSHEDQGTPVSSGVRRTAIVCRSSEAAMRRNGRSPSENQEAPMNDLRRFTLGALLTLGAAIPLAGCGQDETDDQSGSETHPAEAHFTPGDDNSCGSRFCPQRQPPPPATAARPDHRAPGATANAA